MSRTLFIYIFRDLLRIFLLAVAVLSTIMTFGGLLRPLYEFGLDVGQVGAVLTWSTPAMWAYSLPIAALFATTMVYGRLGADNEITACRAAGISHLSLTIPAFLLGIITSLLSLVLLCFIVPACTLKVERIIYSNIAELIVGQIERSHQIRFDQGSQPVTVFAQAAEIVPPPDPTHPKDQAVRLIGPVIVRYVSQDRNKAMVPDDFFMARSAIAVIRQEHSDDDPTLVALLDQGAKFPRTYTAGNKRSMQMSLDTTRFGPTPMQSPVRENTKFMDVFRLRDMLKIPEESRSIRSLLRTFIDRDQAQKYLQQLLAELNGPTQTAQIDTASEHYRITRGSAPAAIEGDRLVLGGDLGGTTAKFDELRGSDYGIRVEAVELHIRPYPNGDEQKIDLDIDMIDCKVASGEETAEHQSFSRPLTIPMPSDVAAISNRQASQYISGDLSAADQSHLLRALYRLSNSIVSELWARVSFAVSCLVLVVVGCTLGMIFRSGNFLNAFAVSVIPALLSIALVVTGQHTAENVPWNLPPNWHNTLKLGIALIVSGNAMVAVTGTILLWRLQRK